MQNQYEKILLQLNTKTRSKIMDTSNNHIVKDGKVFTLDGECVDHLYDATLRAKFKQTQREALTSKEVLGDHEKENGGFVFLFYQTQLKMESLLPNLNKPDIARLMFLLTYINYNNNELVYDNGKAIDDETLSTMLKLKKRQYNEYIQKLIDNNVMYMNDAGVNCISEVIAKRGSINTKQLTKHNINYIRMFRNTVRELFLNSTVRELGRLSVIYSVLPYLNLSTNIIAHNPDETDTSRVKPMTISELKDELGYGDVTKFRQSLYKVKIDDAFVFGFFLLEEDKRAMRIVVNPRVVCACNAEQLQAIKSMFNSSK